MGIIEPIGFQDQRVRIEMLLTTGWRRSAVRLLEMVEEEWEGCRRR